MKQPAWATDPDKVIAEREAFEREMDTQANGCSALFGCLFTILGVLGVAGGLWALFHG